MGAMSTIPHRALATRQASARLHMAALWAGVAERPSPAAIERPGPCLPVGLRCGTPRRPPVETPAIRLLTSTPSTATVCSKLLRFTANYAT